MIQMNKNKFNITSIVILLFLFFVVGIIVGFCMKQQVQAANTTTLTETTDSVTENTSVTESTTEESTTEATTIYIAPVTTRETTTEELTTIKYEDIPNLRLIGTFRYYHYCREEYPHICNEGAPYLTKMETKPKANYTVAVDPSVIPLGTSLFINGKYYLAEDTGGSIKGNRIDICVDSHEEALSKGTGYVKVYEVVG